APIYHLVEGTVLVQTILSIIIGYQAYNSLRAAISIRALRKKLKEGKPIDHHAPWKKHHRITTVISFLFMVVSGLTAVVPFTQLVKSDVKTLPVESPNLPIVRLADVEQNPALVRGESEYMRDNVDWSNRISYNWSPFAPVQYETDENGVVPGETWKDGSGEYSPSISTNFYQLSISAISDHLVYDLIDWYRHENAVEEYVKKQHPDFDLLIVHEDEEMKEVFASKDKNVIYVRYHGYADIDSVIENIKKKIN
ncbi:hypothetical protein NXY55_22955, partial [Aeromonas veronii]|nr:hypothetical protein [Aeromonas veronii]